MWFARVRAAFPDRHLGALLGAYALLSVATEAYSRALPLFVRSMGIPIAVLGLAESLAAGVEAVASAPLGVMADRADRATVAGIAGLGLAALFAFLGTVGITSPPGLVAIVVVIAVIRLAFSNSITPLVESALDEASGMGWGFYGAAVYLGGAIGLGLAGLVIGAGFDVDVQLAFLVVVPALLGAVCVLWLVHPPVSPSLSALRSGRPDLGSLTPPALIGEFRAVSRPRVLAGLCLADALVTIGMSSSTFLLPVLAVDIGVSPRLFFLGFGGSLLMGGVLSLLGGWLADQVPSQTIYVGNFLAEAATLSAFALAGGAPLFAVGVALYTIQTAFESGYIDYLFSLFEENETGRVWGLNGTVNKAAGALGPALGGVLYGVSPNAPFAVGAVFVGLGTLIAASLPRS